MEAAGDKKREGPLSLSGWHVKALGRVCGEPLVLRFSKRETGWLMSVAISVGLYVP